MSADTLNAAELELQQKLSSAEYGQAHLFGAAFEAAPVERKKAFLAQVRRPLAPCPSHRLPPPPPLRLCRLAPAGRRPPLSPPT